MPALHELIVNEGMTLSAAHTVSPICCPSRTSLFSGRYPHNLADDTLGWCGNFSKAMDDTWMTSLHDAGYTIMQSGKWFNSEASFCSKGWLPSWKRAGDANELFLLCEEGKYFNNTYNRNGVIGTASTGATTYMTSVLGNHTLEFLKTATRAAAPWVAYVGIHAPHLPATPAPWYADAPMPPHAPRTASWNTAWQDKHWVIDNGVDKPMSEALINGSDALHAQRLRTLLSVDDLVRDVVALLQANGALDNTYIIYTSDHGYHLGQSGMWCEKGMPFDTDTHIPLFVRGPGIARGSTSSALVSMNVDLGATILELAGIPNAWPGGGGVRDGTSLVPVLHAPDGATPPGWRTRTLLEFVGWINPYEWLQPCTWGLAPGTPCGPNAPAGLINAASNRWSALRVDNATTRTLVADFRPPQAPLARASTNFTEAYNLAADPEAMVNVAVRGRLSPVTLDAMRTELWELAACVGAQCP